MNPPGAGNRTVAAGTRAGIAVVHDPLTGLTHRAFHPLQPGRVRLDDAQINAWPTIAAHQLRGRLPVSVCWSPLTRCNLSCPYCLDDTRVADVFPAARLRIAEILGGSGVLGVDVSGGEPLLLRDLTALLDRLSPSTAVSVTTNGWHLARRAVELAGKVDAVRVSLDGPDSARHDRWRGTGSFARAVQGISVARDHGIPLRLQTVLLRSNQHHAQAMVDLAAELGTSGVTFLQMLPIGEGRHLAADEQLSDQRAQDLIDTLDVPAEVTVRLRTRAAAGGFTVIRADGHVWRNDPDSTGITTLHPLRSADDLALTGEDGSA
ncbi:MoaA/NifB/PqqE/SkfB family radical SAM enzyme [Actinoalloteichus hoggarensis]|uniref:Antilisterial bacteriocin subtilosin biosynthesis protein AlbA n=1 Tax=Actinoalloteichus hoggarensis TaxID=1470176 RepID=A0A221W790_9PSEU|nr:radical SAM protein [Actinoalloteichus hoggarensis]ASO21571.1 Antilisterial bacteriocin subtilosin biosynthesis protein AlbA [Actinoalloteichus hoggarensis]MBB5922163.1 MoaA/NifB/PqqE/SkfB family radical SAM enzyme [Actinoalloteichus hoggarensis]